MKYLKYLFLSLIIISIAACSDEDPDDMMPEPMIELIQAAFTIDISDSDPYTAIFTNTSDVSGDYTAVWDFGQGDGEVTDMSDQISVRYPEAGDYTITLQITNEAGTTSASEDITVGDIGICTDGAVCTGLPALQSAAPFLVGMAVATNKFGDQKYMNILRRDFNSVTAEWQMKMNIMHPSEGVFSFDAADAIVDLAEANGMNVHGHALIWHSATPSWVENFSGSDEEFETMVKDYITTVVSRYKGRVRSWDVVNEALSDDAGHPLRESVFLQRMGPDYVKKCHQWARDADPDVLLFYNDYNIAGVESKRNAAFDLIEDLGDLADGIGAQSHININWPSAAQIQDLIDKTVANDLLLHISEIDVRTNTEDNASLSSLSSAKAEAQAAKYKEVVSLFNAMPTENQYAITVWGLRDDQSWLINFWGVPEWPLLYDASYQRKLAYQGFLDGLE